MTRRSGFTLIELLTVLAIIGVVAALVVNMNAGAQAAKRNAAVNASKAKLMIMIDQYQSRLNFFPPDNGNLVTYSGTPSYDSYASINPLLYELSGGTNMPDGTLQLFDGLSNHTILNYSNVFARNGLANANADEPHNFFRPLPQAKDYTSYGISGATDMCGLLVPVAAGNPNFPTNFWHYDASTTNRHNQNTYDLWAEYQTGGNASGPIIQTNGNW